MAACVFPAGHPCVPSEADPKDLVAIVIIHNAQAYNSNRNTSYHKSPIIPDGDRRMTRGATTGFNIFLRQINGQHCFIVGRAMVSNVNNKEALDLYLPGATIGLRQCALIPVWEHNCWWLRSVTEKIAVTNGAP
jgi:hypothetical protein